MSWLNNLMIYCHVKISSLSQFEHIGNPTTQKFSKISLSFTVVKELIMAGDILDDVRQLIGWMH